MSVRKPCMIILAMFSLATAGFAEIALDFPEHDEPETIEDKPVPQPKPKPLTLAVDLLDGSLMIGIPAIKSMPLKTAYAEINIPLEKIQSIIIGDKQENASFELKNGDKLKGSLSLKPLKLEAIFGKVSIPTELIRNIEVRSGGGPLSANIRKGLVLDCSFDRKENGKVTDRSKFGNHGKVHGATWIANGKRGGAYNFNGNSDRIVIPDSNSLDIQGGELTISAWIKPSAIGRAPRPIVSKWDDGAGGRNNRTWYLSISNHRTRSGMLISAWHNLGNNSSENWRAVIGKKQLTTKKWQHTALTIKKGEASLFIDGKLDSTTSTGSFGSFFNNNRPVYIGGGEISMPSGFKYFSGAIDEVLVFNRALSKQEIKQIYNSQK